MNARSRLLHPKRRRHSLVYACKHGSILAVEALEERRVLTTIADVMPGPNAASVALETQISATFDQDIDPATVTGETFVIRGSQTGRLGISPSDLHVEGAVVTFVGPRPFHPGETVEVTLSRNIKSQSGETVDSDGVFDQLDLIAVLLADQYLA